MSGSRAAGMRLNRFAIALSAYALLVVLVLATIDNKQLRLVSLAILALFAVKTIVRRRDVMHSDDDEG